FLALAAHPLLARWLRPPRSTGLLPLGAWVHLLARQRGPLLVWRAQLAPNASSRVVDELRRHLPAPAGAAQWRRWLFWFEPAPGAARGEWLARCGGLLVRLESFVAPGGASGRAAAGAVSGDDLVMRGWLSAP